MEPLSPFIIKRLNQKVDPSLHPDASLLTGFVENALPKELRLQLMEHLAGCSACRRVARLSLPQREPDALPQMVLAWPRTKFRFAVRWAMTAVVAASVLVAIWVVRMPTGFVGSSSSNPPVAANTTQTAVAEPSSAIIPSVETKTSVAPAKSDKTQSPFLAAGEATRKILPSREMIQTSVALNGNNEPSPNRILLPVQDARPAIRWMIAGPGIVYQSFDEGQRWQSVDIREGVLFSAVTSLGHIVWAGGPSGLLFRSEDDGIHWKQIIPSAELTGNIDSIRFQDVRHGAITISDGTVWETFDGGDTWRKR